MKPTPEIFWRFLQEFPWRFQCKFPQECLQEFLQVYLQNFFLSIDFGDFSRNLILMQSSCNSIVNFSWDSLLDSSLDFFFEEAITQKLNERIPKEFLKICEEFSESIPRRTPSDISRDSQRNFLKFLKDFLRPLEEFLKEYHGKFCQEVWK